MFKNSILFTGQVREAFRIISEDKQVKAILVNVFGGIVNCATIANGIVNACRSINLELPLVVRLEGTNVDNAKQILKDSYTSLSIYAEAIYKFIQNSPRYKIYVHVHDKTVKKTETPLKYSPRIRTISDRSSRSYLNGKEKGLTSKEADLKSVL